MTPWSDTNRFNQSGYSSPTLFPSAHAYASLEFFLEDTIHAIAREQSRREWLEEEAWNARQEYLEQQAEIKAERDLHDY